MKLLFEPDIKFPHSDFQLFKACNDAPRKWYHKQQFYILKNEILEKYADHFGFDKQIIEDKCYYCRGTGWYNSDFRCGNCNNGIYATRTFILKRYILNGTLFHRPIDRMDSPIINTIKGIIEHPYPEICYDFAYACLLRKYKPEQFHNYLLWLSKTFTKSDKKRWREIAARSKNIIDALAMWYEVSINNDDDLPF